jgi:FkbM family methyltransferase
MPSVGEGIRRVTQQMFSTLKNSALAWQLRRSSVWKRYRQHPSRPAEIKFYGRLIDASEPGCIIDVGANHGSKTEIFVDLASRVIAIEPDPSAAMTLQKRFRWKPVEVIQAAISSDVGVARFYRFEPGSAYNTLSDDWAIAMIDGSNHQGLQLPKPALTHVRTQTLADIVARFSPIKYIKIDAEGFEDKVLSTLTIPVPLISMEFNLPQMCEAMLTCVRHLERTDARYLFNFALSDPPIALVLDEWLSGDDTISRIRLTGRKYVDIYARLTTKDASACGANLENRTN